MVNDRQPLQAFRLMALQQRPGDAVDGRDIPRPAFDVNQRLAMAAAKGRLREEWTVARQGSHFFAQRVIAGLRVRSVTDRASSAKIRQREVPILLPYHQKAAVLEPFAARCRVVKTPDHLHLRELRDQRIAAGLAEDKPRLLPVGQQVKFRPAGVGVDGQAPGSQ